MQTDRIVSLVALLFSLIRGAELAHDWFKQRRTRDGIPVDEILDSTYLEFVRELVKAGAMISTGSTRDGGTLHLTVFYDGSNRREYVGCAEEVADFLGEALDAITGSGVKGGASGKRSTTGP